MWAKIAIVFQKELLRVSAVIQDELLLRPEGQFSLTLGAYGDLGDRHQTA